MWQMAAFVSRIFGLNFWVVGESGHVLSIIIYSLWLVTLKYVLMHKSTEKTKAPFKIPVWGCPFYHCALSHCSDVSECGMFSTPVSSQERERRGILVQGYLQVVTLSVLLISFSNNIILTLWVWWHHYRIQWSKKQVSHSSCFQTCTELQFLWRRWMCDTQMYKWETSGVSANKNKYEKQSHILRQVFVVIGANTGVDVL